jgi:hypothetical protein
MGLWGSSFDGEIGKMYGGGWVRTLRMGCGGKDGVNKRVE